MPILEQHEVAAYLLERRLISRRSIVSGRLRVVDASSRNRNFRVSGGPGESYLLKQGIVADSAQTLANEVAMYRRLTRDASPFAPFLPRLHGHDGARGLLILEWIDGGVDLDRLVGTRGRCSVALAAALGRALAALHAVAPDDEDLRRDPPWVLALHRPPLDALRCLSAASIELVKLLQRDDGCGAAFDELREGWRVEALVHRDVKWANWIAFAPGGGGGGDGRVAAVKLVDWEMAGWGDPAFDVGSALSDFAGFGLGRGRGPVQRASSALWRAYVRARRLGGPAASALLERSVRFGGARLVQSAFEHTQEAVRLSEDVAARVRVGRELLVAPRDAARERLGIAS